METKELEIILYMSDLIRELLQKVSDLEHLLDDKQKEINDMRDLMKSK